MTISNLDADTKEAIRYQVERAMELFPNAHLGDYSRRQDMHSAFRMIRSHAEHQGYIQAGVGALSRDLYRYEDM